VSQLIVLADDWGRHPSSCQHLVRAMLERARAQAPRSPGPLELAGAVWINTIGMRRPGLSQHDLAKATGRVRSWIGAAAPVPEAPRLSVISPLMIPSFRRPWQRRCNALLVGRAVGKALANAGAGPRVGLATIPIAGALAARLPVDRWIYYCVDDFTVWPGLDGELMKQLERELVRGAHRVVAASPILRERLESLGARASVLTHGVDLAHWRNAHSNGNGAREAGGVFADLSILSKFARPILLFWGLVDRRLDAAWLAAAAKAAGSVVLVGPHQDPDPSIGRLDNVHVPGAVPYTALPALARHADALIMPYTDAEATRSAQPLKLKEYLATDKPVIVRELPATREWSDAADVVATIEDFGSAIRARLDGGTPEAQLRARGRLAAESWEAKSLELEAIVLECARACTPLLTKEG
jgi:glycosyltransferase involved in cell wall biosynthesis